MANIFDKIKDWWGNPKGRDPTFGAGYTQMTPYRSSYLSTGGATSSIKSMVIMKMAIDVSMLDFNHVMVDENDGFLDKIDDDLNDRLKYFANKDQTAKEFVREAITSMLEDGSVGIMAVDSDVNYLTHEEFNVWEWRCCRILEYFPNNVKVEVWNTNKSRRDTLVLPKNKVARIPNPFYEVMNRPNFALNALGRKMGLDDEIDNQLSSNRLDMVIQLPYSTNDEKRKTIANRRREEIQEQLSNSKYGIAYLDVQEKIIQLNRPIENQTQSQIEYYENRFYNMTGLTAGVLNGTAGKDEMNNYYNRCTRVLAVALAEGIQFAFIPFARIKQGERVRYFRNPFESVTINDLPDLIDKLGRAEVISPNEVRRELGYKPSEDPSANELRNRNLSQPGGGGGGMPTEGYEEDYPPEAYEEQ